MSGLYYSASPNEGVEFFMSIETRNDYTALQRIIIDLIQDLADLRKIWSDLRIDNPSFEQFLAEHWREREAESWLYGTTAACEINVLSQGVDEAIPLSVIADSEVLNHIKRWSHYIAEMGIYADFVADDLRAPEPNDTLLKYIQKHAEIAEEHAEKATNAF